MRIWFKLATAAAMAIAVVVMLTELARAQDIDDPLCNPGEHIDAIYVALTKYNEGEFFRGETPDGGTWGLFYSKDNDTWTLTFSWRGQVCVLGVGENPKWAPDPPQAFWDKYDR